MSAHYENKLLQIIKQSGLSQREIARRAGISNSTVSRIMNGGSNTSFKVFEKIAWACNVEMDGSPKHVEMIVDYTVDGDDFKYNDNHGLLVRCKDCKHYIEHGLFRGLTETPYCGYVSDEENVWAYPEPDDFCSKGVKRQHE